MASRHGSRLAIAAAVLLASLTASLAADGSVGTVLLNDDFAAAAVGTQPGPWVYFVDEGNAIAVADAPGVGGRCLKLTRTGGTVWKPMVSGWAAGEAGNTVLLECDWFLPALSTGREPLLIVTIRGDGNNGVIQVGLGGQGGVAVADDKQGWVPLGFRLQPGQWGHLTITAGPLSRKEAGAFDLTVSQGGEQLSCPNVAFKPNHLGQFPSELWHSPTFQVGGGTAEQPHAALVTRVRLTVAKGREDR